MIGNNLVLLMRDDCIVRRMHLSAETDDAVVFD